MTSFCRFVRDGGLTGVGDKTIFTWGVCLQVYDVLLAVGRKIEGCIGSNSDIAGVTGVKVICQEDVLSYKDVYIIVTAENYQDIVKFLNAVGFKYYENYIVVEKEERILNAVDHYADMEGNIVDSQTYIKDCRVIVQGYGSKVYVGTNVSFGKNCKIAMGYNSVITIGNNCLFDDDTEINVWENASLKIGSNCSFGKRSLVSSANQVVIGNNNWFGFDTYLVTGYDGKIVIGNDCLFSNYIKFRPDNGHSIYDVGLQKDVKELHANEILVDDHVWWGLDVIALGDTAVGSGSVVGAGTLLKGTYPGHSVIAGNPARIIRENVTWDASAKKQWEFSSAKGKKHE